MSPTTIADPALIPDIEAFEERVAIHIHEGGIPTEVHMCQSQVQTASKKANYALDCTNFRQCKISQAVAFT
jgi:hypothetical protein